MLCRKGMFPPPRQWPVRLGQWISFHDTAPLGHTTWPLILMDLFKWGRNENLHHWFQLGLFIDSVWYFTSSLRHVLSISQQRYIHNAVSQALEFQGFPKRVTDSLQVLQCPKPAGFSGVVVVGWCSGEVKLFKCVHTFSPSFILRSTRASDQFYYFLFMLWHPRKPGQNLVLNQHLHLLQTLKTYSLWFCTFNNSDCFWQEFKCSCINKAHSQDHHEVAV